VTDHIFVFPHACGSSSTSIVLLELIKAGSTPRAIINNSVDPIVALGSIVADEMYQQSIPVVVLTSDDFADMRSGDYLTIELDGTVRRKFRAREESDRK
jgi:predicted aconitase with swiveling domain